MGGFCPPACGQKKNWAKAAESIGGSGVSVGSLVAVSEKFRGSALSHPLHRPAKKQMPLAYISELAARNFKSNAGIYIISEHAPTKKGVRLVKIGRSIDVRKRLNAYHIC